MDLSHYDVKSASAKGADLHLKHPMTGELLFDDEKEPLFVRVIGRDSPVVKAAMDDVKKRRARGEEISSEDEGILYLCAVTVGWSENIELDGERLEYTEKNARKIYSDPRTEWIGEQVGPFALARRNFAKNLSSG